MIAITHNSRIGDRFSVAYALLSNQIKNNLKTEI